MKKRLYLIGTGIVALFLTVGPSYAQISGGVPVRIPAADGVQSRCIDPSKDRVWLTLRRLVTTKASGWFTKDNSVEVVIAAQVRTDPPPPKPLSFPLTTEAKFGDGPPGQVSVPIEYPIVSGLTLKQSDATYTGLGVEVTLLNLRDRNTLGSALQALSTITGSSKLPIPASPYTQGLTYLLEFANKAVGDDIDNHNKDDKAKSGALDFNFAPTGSCADGDFETTGTKAIVYSTGFAGQGSWLVDFQHISDYCWSAELSPVFILKATKQENNLPCQDSSYKSKFREITNNYVAFYLNKVVASTALGPTEEMENDRRESLQRCQANGVSQAALCPGWNN